MKIKIKIRKDMRLVDGVWDNVKTATVTIKGGQTLELVHILSSPEQSNWNGKDSELTETAMIFLKDMLSYEDFQTLLQANSEANNIVATKF